MQKILYFGYGANASKEMMRSLIGRVPNGFKAKLKDYGLFVQGWKEIPLIARNSLRKSWNSSFSSYVAVPLKNEVVHGIAWKIKKSERAVISSWELHGKWYKPIKVKIENSGGEFFDAQTEIIYDFNFRGREIISGEDYTYFLNDKEKMLKLARKVRSEFLGFKTGK